MKTIILVAVMSMSIAYTFAQRPYDNRYPDNYNTVPAPQYGGGANCPPNGNYQNGYSGLRIEDLARDIRIRLDMGFRNGSLNRRESYRLSESFDRIEMKARYFRADGYLTRYEEQELRADLLTLSDNIYRELNDGQYRSQGGYGRGNRNEHDRDNRNYRNRNYRGW
jgi:hypothetical protein